MHAALSLPVQSVAFSVISSITDKTTEALLWVFHDSAASVIMFKAISVFYHLKGSCDISKV